MLLDERKPVQGSHRRMQGVRTHTAGKRPPTWRPNLAANLIHRWKPPGRWVEERGGRKKAAFRTCAMWRSERKQSLADLSGRLLQPGTAAAGRDGGPAYAGLQGIINIRPLRGSRRRQTWRTSTSAQLSLLPANGRKRRLVVSLYTCSSGLVSAPPQL